MCTHSEQTSEIAPASPVTAVASPSVVPATTAVSADVDPPSLPVASHAVSKRPASSPPAAGKQPPAGKRIHLSNRKNVSAAAAIPSTRRETSSVASEDKENCDTRKSHSNRGPQNNNTRIIVAHSTQHGQYLRGMRRMGLEVKV